MRNSLIALSFICSTFSYSQQREYKIVSTQKIDTIMSLTRLQEGIYFPDRAIEYEYNSNSVFSLPFYSNIERTKDSSFIATYEQNSTQVICKIDKNGVVKWRNILPDISFKIAVKGLLNEDFVVYGSTDKNIGQLKNYGGLDFFVARLDSLGKILWEKNYGGSKDDECTCVNPTKEGGFIIMGNTKSFDKDSKGYHRTSIRRDFKDFTNDILIIKTNSQGEIEWKKPYGGSEIDVPNSGNDKGLWIEQVNEGGYIVAGISSSHGYGSDFKDDHNYFSFDPHPMSYPSDVVVFKLNAQGSLEWYKMIGGKATEILLNFFNTQNDGYLISGYTSSLDHEMAGNPFPNHNGGYNRFEYDLTNSNDFVAKVDFSGNLRWITYLSSPYKRYANENFRLFQKDIDNGFIVGGVRNFTVYDAALNRATPFDSSTLIKLDYYGKEVWRKSFSLGEVYGVFPNLDGSYNVISKVEQSSKQYLALYKIWDKEIVVEQKQIKQEEPKNIKITPKTSPQKIIQKRKS